VPIGWEEALDEAEQLLRGAGGRIVTALSGSETVEIAYGLGKLLRVGLNAHSAVLPEETSRALDGFRAPLSTIRDAELVVVIGDDPVVERAPIVDLWIRAARRRGAEVETIGPHGTVPAEPGTGAAACKALATPSSELGQRLRGSERAVLIWSGPGGQGGAHLAALANELGFAARPGCAAFHLPATPNGRGVADAWAAAADSDEANPEPIGLLVVSGDEAAADPNVRVLARDAEKVLAIGMFRRPLRGWTDLVLPGTSYLERDGTTINLEGRLQRLRRAVIPPCPDELAWLSRLAERFEVELSPHPSLVFAELSEICYDGLAYGRVGERAPLPARAEQEAVEPARREPKPERLTGKGLKLVAYRPLFSGPDVERVPELQFQRPGPEVEVSADDADRRGIVTGDPVVVTSNGTSLNLRARVNRKLMKGVVRVPFDHAHELARRVEVRKP
jgi:NADH-quinone oxidoreductase subunit G